MQEVKDLWNPIGFHGELTVEGDVEATIKEAIRQLAFANPAVATYRDIRYSLRTRYDGSKVVYFELLR